MIIENENNDNEKYRYYYNKVSSLCSHSKFLLLPEYTKKDRFKIILSSKLPKEFLYEKVFFASINKLAIHYILSKNKGINDIFTFDDGTANIIETSFFHKKETNSFSLSKWIIKTLFRIKFSQSKVLESIKAHYTIYPEHKNISKNLIPLKLIEDNIYKKTPHKNNQKLSILIGQPIFNSPDKNIELINKCISKFKIQFYFPHPREIYKIEKVTYIKTKYIFEDWVIKNIETFSEIDIYTFFSSAAINISKVKNTNIHVIPVEGFENEINLMTRFPITITNV
ncbi:glycosyltransferase family 52 [Testudinibacter sp. P27/CKL/0425]